MGRCVRGMATLLVVGSCSAAFAGCSNDGSFAPVVAGCCVCDRPPGPLVTPPARPSAHPVSGETRWFVLHTVQFEPVAGKPSADGWEHVGFDLDGRDTTSRQSKDQTDTCRRVPESPTGVLADGCGGIDNNFLGHAVPELEALIEFFPSPHNVEPDSNAAIAAGVETLLVRVDDVTSGDEGHAPGAVFRTGSFPGRAPTFESSETWPVTSDSLTDGKDLAQPIVTFPNGYVTGGTWVSGVASTRFALALYPGKRSGDPRLELPIDHGMMVFDLASGVGTIAGAMGVDAFKSAVTPWVETWGTCPGHATFEQAMTQFSQDVDLVLDAPQLQDTTRDCDAISLGIGVTMARASAPTEVVPPISPPMPTSDCTSADAGPSDAPDDSDASESD